MTTKFLIPRLQKVLTMARDSDHRHDLELRLRPGSWYVRRNNQLMTPRPHQTPAPSGRQLRTFVYDSAAEPFGKTQDAF
jgi:hypothetical protein